jgi:hypothetical protein
MHCTVVAAPISPLALLFSTPSGCLPRRSPPLSTTARRRPTRLPWNLVGPPSPSQVGPSVLFCRLLRAHSMSLSSRRVGWMRGTSTSANHGHPQGHRLFEPETLRPWILRVSGQLRPACPWPLSRSPPAAILGASEDSLTARPDTVIAHDLRCKCGATTRPTGRDSRRKHSETCQQDSAAWESMTTRGRYEQHLSVGLNPFSSQP